MGLWAQLSAYSSSFTLLPAARSLLAPASSPSCDQSHQALAVDESNHILWQLKIMF